jgi:HD superfamily phosphodiesterase
MEKVEIDSLESWEDYFIEKARPHLLRGRPADYCHTLRAIRYGKALLKNELGDPEIVITALALHDLGWSQIDYQDFLLAPLAEKKDTPSCKEHMIQGAKMAREILNHTNFPKAKKKLVLEIIACHDEPDAILAMSEPEAILVMEADCLDRFGMESEERYRIYGEKIEEEKRLFLLEGAKIWFRTATARRIVEEILAKFYPFDLI